MLKTFLQLYGTLVVRNLAYSTSTTAMAAHMRAVRIKSFGDPSQLYIEDQEPIPQLASNHDVLLHVAATALNRADTLQRKGGYNPPKGASDILGLEASGVIEKIGSNVQGFKEGDRVMALLAGIFAHKIALFILLKMSFPNFLCCDLCDISVKVYAFAYVSQFVCIRLFSSTRT
uniref:Alcohol dehydrogenase-like N-terminal domain-containing protein n=1 Tax=Clytia hemisphaerica TaxID=252671 RepID=A0A7M6DNH7_9CNID